MGHYVHLLTVIIVCFFLAICSGQRQQSLTLYEGRDGQGASLLVYEPYISQLGNLQFDGRARSACLTGMWLLYDLPFYNYARDGPMQYHFGPNNYCVNLEELQGKVSSVRSVGNYFDFEAETVSLYEKTFFQGVDEFIYGDIRTANLDQRVSSLIITGRASWTLYDGPNFRDTGRGNSVCITPKNNDGRPLVITDTNNVRIPNRVIRSVRKGCGNNARRVYV